MKETPPQMQVLRSQTPALTRRTLAAAQAAKEQAKMQAEMMKQIMTMFQPGGAPQQPGIGGMMQPQQQGQAPQEQPKQSSTPK